MNQRKLITGMITGMLWAAMLACNGVSHPDLSPFLPSSPARQAISTSMRTADRLERDALIPKNAIKMSPAIDEKPPVLYSNEYEKPVPVPGQINTAGAEDGVFVSPDGNTLYFFFTPDVNVPAEKQILDGVTGLYVSQKQNGSWGKPERIVLQEPGKLALDGCVFVQENLMWFCSAREGYTGIHWFTAEYRDGKWQNWKNADFNPKYEVGELHISRDGRQLYFGSKKPGGKGDLDIWISEWVNGVWQEPINLAALNTPNWEGWPALNPAENELWFTRTWGVWRSKKVNGQWQAAQQIVSPLAGEPSLDNEGNLYFVHHFYVGDKMIEADIYVAYKKK